MCGSEFKQVTICGCVVFVLLCNHRVLLVPFPLKLDNDKAPESTAFSKETNHKQEASEEA